MAYTIGGVMGLALLFLRVTVHESGLFEAVKRENVSCGNFLSLFTSRARFLRYLSCIAVGLPIWLAVGILVTFSPEIAAVLGVQEPIKVSTATLIFTVGSVSGDLCSGILSQLIRSRKKVIAGFLSLNAASTATLLLAPIHTAGIYLAVCSVIGFSVGYWAVLVTTAAEQFGTNLRATVTTTVPNFVRSAALPMTWSFVSLRASMGIIGSIAIVACVALVCAGAAIVYLHETFSRDLNFIEGDETEKELLQEAA